MISEYQNNDMVSSKDQVEIFTYNQTETIMLDVNGNEIDQWYSVYYMNPDPYTLTCYSQYGRPGPQFT